MTDMKDKRDKFFRTQQLKDLRMGRIQYSTNEKIGKYIMLSDELLKDPDFDPCQVYYLFEMEMPNL